MTALLLALTLCPVMTKGKCTETKERTAMGVFSYNRSAAYCKVNPKGTAWWLDHVYQHKWVSRSCKDFLKTYKPSTK